MYEFQYHLINPYYRENVDLRNYIRELINVAGDFTNIRLNLVGSDYYQITVYYGKINKTVRELGRAIARRTPLRCLVEHKTNKNELFIRRPFKEYDSSTDKTSIVVADYIKERDAAFYDITK